MPATDISGLTDIQFFAQRLGIDISDTVAKARMLMQTDPAAVRSAGERLTTLADGLNDRRQFLSLAGSRVLAGWEGTAADAFGPHQTELLDGISGGERSSRTLATHLDGVASVFEQSQHTVVTATGATATALRIAVLGV
jgi:hypothetical protein